MATPPKPPIVAPGTPVTPVTPAPPAPAAGTTTVFPVTGSSPTATVTVPNQTGAVTFQLVVTDNLGQQSAPATVTVTIQGPPTASVAATPTTIKPGAPITLSGAKSTAQAPGSITTYTFTVVS